MGEFKSLLSYLKRVFEEKMEYFTTKIFALDNEEIELKCKLENIKFQKQKNT